MAGETPPDIQPGFFDCNLASADGKTYLGTVTRDNQTWESVSQKLRIPLDSGICYSFTIQLATSPSYNSKARVSGDTANYNQPVVFQVWGGYSECDARVLLAESPVISHREWKKYRFIIKSLQDRPLPHLVFQAYYPPGNRCKPTMGNLLMDDASDIKQTDCPANFVSRMDKAEAKTPRLRSETDLDSLLTHHLGALRYTHENNIAFELECDDTYEGVALFYSKHLAAVSDALRQFPEKKLTVRLKSAGSGIHKKRAKFLDKYLRAIGLPQHQYEVITGRSGNRYAWKISTKWLEASW